MAIWDYFTVPESIEGTTLHADGAGPRYMEWVWQIPIHPRTMSVGYVSPGEAVKEKRQRGLSIQDIFNAQLKQFPDLQGLCHDAGRRSRLAPHRFVAVFLPKRRDPTGWWPARLRPWLTR